MVGTAVAPPIDVWAALSTAGQPLDPVLRNRFEPRFGHLFSDVRVHRDEVAGRAANSLAAQAFTVGRHVVFAPGAYDPSSAPGRRLIAHELAHVVQQGAAPPESDGLVVQRQEAGAAPTPSPPRPPPRRINVDVLGSDIPVGSSIVLAAASALGVDIRVNSLDDMIGQLEARTGTGACVQDLQIWNHAAPGYQEVYGSGGMKLPAGAAHSGFSAGWLFDPSHQPALTRFRNVLCCGATMRWRGCGSVGIQTASGVRSDEERVAHRERYGRYGDRFQTAADVAAHGGSLFAATLGQVDARLWADATCATITASTDFNLVGPNEPGGSSVQYGGTNLLIAPEPGECTCDAATRRPAGGAPTLGHLYERETALRAAVIGADHEWDLHLRRVRNPGHAPPDGRTASQVLADSMLRLVLIVSRRLTLPAPLTPKPDDQVRPRLDRGTGGDRAQAAVYSNLAFCEPDNYWRWLVVSPGIFVSTPEFTAGILLHELRHAADITVAAATYQRDHRLPPGTPTAAQCQPASPADIATWTDPWGTHVRDFIDFWHRGLSATRHLEIAMGEREVFQDRWTVQEKLDWLRGILEVLPPRVPGTVALPGEDAVNSLFTNAGPALRQGIVSVFREPLEQLLQPVTTAGGGTAARHASCDRLFTQFTHFRPIALQVFAYYSSAGGGRFVPSSAATARSWRRQSRGCLPAGSLTWPRRRSGRRQTATVVAAAAEDADSDHVCCARPGLVRRRPPAAARTGQLF